MDESSRHVPVCTGLDGPALPPPGKRGVVLQELNGRRDGGVMASPHLVRDALVGQNPQQRDALWGRETERVACHPLCPALPLVGEAAAKCLTGELVAAVAEELLHLFGAHRADEAERLGAAPHPAPRLLAVAGKVILSPEADLLG